MSLSHLPLLPLLLAGLGMLLTTPTDAATKRHTRQPHAKQHTKQAPSLFRQPAYITNAYFADQVVEGENGAVQPLSAVKALRRRASGPLGYLILDLMLTTPGVHTLRVDILNQRGDKVDTISYPPLKAAKQGDLPLYTAASPITGNFSAGLWFFKIFDQVNNGTWYALDTLGVVVLEAEKSEQTQ